ncbi:hypothetical protein OF83DRAFT_1161922 [Amylostereum chailletii]|nr:hypothetical protein OF83DRAFT_1161922 [Amylostereum chailletii]
MAVTTSSPTKQTTLSVPIPVSPAKVDFPSTDPTSTTPPSSYVRPPHLPFRRISLPSANNRVSVASVASFDSLYDEAHHGVPVTPPNRSPARRQRSRPTSIEPQKKLYRKHELRPVDEEREAKRRKIIEEFYETERTYVEGLDLIYSHFLTPIIASLDTSQPLLDRSELTSVFSNFIDIWNLHRAFFSSLTEHLRPSLHPSSLPRESPPPLSPVLLPHFPYLSLYTPFVTSFHTSMSSLTTLLTTNAAFSAFIAKQETDPQCGKLKLRDWLLTIVQRCPRYLLLLKDLIGCTDAEDPECASLKGVHTLVSKITSSLNASLHTHAQTLALLALQRNTPNLPFQLISPGRTFLKRGTLLQFERSALLKERDFLLFSDTLLWLENQDRSDADAGERWDWLGGGGGGGNVVKGKPGARPSIMRLRSRSEAELLPLFRGSPVRASPGKAKKRQASSGAGEEKWWFKGRAELVDLEVVVSPAAEEGDEVRFEILSPEESFVVYAETEQERDEWVAAIRNAKASLLVSLNVTHPNSTLTSSASTAHLRRTLQALPHRPEDDARKPKRGKVEHFVPAIWIPDARTESCMRCGKPFGWRRRRHHCRLCGRCVCSSCSGSTFFISDPNGIDARPNSKSARACDACYDTVFPVISPSASPTLPSTMPTIKLHNFQPWHVQPASASPPASRPASMLMALESPKRNGRRGLVSDTQSELLAPHSPLLPSPISERSGDSALGRGASEGEGGDADGCVHMDGVVDVTTPPRPVRFSLPAIALQTTPVTARSSVIGEGKAKRYSLVMGMGNGAGDVFRAQESGEGGGEGEDGTLKRGAAVSKLSELLGRSDAARTQG